LNADVLPAAIAGPARMPAAATPATTGATRHHRKDRIRKLPDPKLSTAKLAAIRRFIRFSAY